MTQRSKRPARQTAHYNFSTVTPTLLMVTVAGSVAVGVVITAWIVDELSQHCKRTIAGMLIVTVPAAVAVTVCVAPGIATPSLNSETV
jgi:hypothetical protein